MKNRLRLLVTLLIYCCFSLTAIPVQAASNPIALAKPLFQTPPPTATPAYNWNQPTRAFPTETLNLFTQTSQAQLTQIAGSFTPTIVTPTPTATSSFTAIPTEATLTPTIVTPEPTSTRPVYGESRLLIGSDRYAKSNYWAIPLGVLFTIALVGAGIVILTKRR